MDIFTAPPRYSRALSSSPEATRTCQFALIPA